MEKRIYTDNFERLLREKSDEFRMIPSKRIWHSIYNDLHPARRWPSLVMSLILVTSLLFIGYQNNISNNHVLAATNAIDGIPGSPSFGQTALQQHPNSIVNSTQNAPRTLVSLPQESSSSLHSLNGQTSSNQYTPAVSNTASGNDDVSFSENIITANSSQSKIILPVINNKTDLSSTTAGNNTIKPVETIVTYSNNPVIVNNGQKDAFVNKEDLPLSNKTTSKNNADISFVEKNIDEKSIPVTTAVNNITPVISATDKAWIEDYALHNKPSRKKWKDRTALELYATPGFTYRTLSSNTKYDAMSSSSVSSPMNSDINHSVNQSPSLSAEIGGSLVYSFAKNFRLKTGMQLNYTSYNIKADETNHPILTTLLLNDLNSGYPYLFSANSTLSNTTGLQQKILHSNTLQLSLPIGLDFKLAGNDKFQWYISSTIQPTYVINGNAYLLSSDRKNYVKDNEYLRKWSLNAGVETFLSYKTNNGISIQVGPQFRYQLPSTYSKKYSLDEKLYSGGLKFGILRNF